jgi:thiamine biosynthesis lipoprotein
VHAEAVMGDEVRLALDAMATRFELILHGADAVRLRAAGEDALGEVARLERQLSFYRPTSDVTWINAHAADNPVKVEPGLFGLLTRCRALSVATDGAFDVTMAPVMRAWRFVGGCGALPDPAALASARAAVGFGHVHLDADASTVWFARAGMGIDLGAAGKGFAVDRAVDVLQAHGVARALLHGGTSSVHVIGTPPGHAEWRIGWAPPGETRRAFDLRDGALSISAVHGRAFESGGRLYGHVIDPRTGCPTDATRAAAVTGPGSFECDALSTALLVLGPKWLPELRSRFPGYDGVVSLGGGVWSNRSAPAI